MSIISHVGMETIGGAYTDEKCLAPVVVYCGLCLLLQLPFIYWADVSVSFCLLLKFLIYLL